MLQHCPKELEAELVKQDSWKTAKYARSVITILLLTRDLSFNKTDRKKSNMSTVEANADLYLGTKWPDQSTDKFYKMFTAHVETINANRESAGFHNGVYNKKIWPSGTGTLSLTIHLHQRAPLRKRH